MRQRDARELVIHAVVVVLLVTIVFHILRKTKRYIALHHARPSPSTFACAHFQLSSSDTAALCVTTNAFHVYLVNGTNPCMLIECKVGDLKTFFVLDTGFAGPVVLSLPCLAMQLSGEIPVVEEDRLFRSSRASDADLAELEAWCDTVHRRLHSSVVTPHDRHAALQRFMRSNKCSDFTAGCTTRLASVGAIAETTSDLVLTPPMMMRGRSSEEENDDDDDVDDVSSVWSSPRVCNGGPAAELLTSTPMKTLHLITIDFIKQCGPALLAFDEHNRTGTFRPNLSEDEFDSLRDSGFVAITNRTRGGAFVASVVVSGVRFHVTVDTGASCYLALSADAAKRLRECKSSNSALVQLGANGERVCSHAIIAAEVDFIGRGAAEDVVDDVPVLVNEVALEPGDDGYVGVCLLQHYDLLVTSSHLYAKRNRRPFNHTLIDSVLSSTSRTNCRNPPSTQCTDDVQ